MSLRRAIKRKTEEVSTSVQVEYSNGCEDDTDSVIQELTDDESAMPRKRARKLCEHPGCTKQPSFNYPGEKTRRFCSQHKKDGMMDVATRKCEHLGCTKRPSFNILGEKTGLFCSQHKENGMVNVQSKKCE